MPSRVDKYSLDTKISEGNYSVVYKALDLEKKPVAVKIAREPTSQCNGLITREYEILSKFRHPNIISVFEYGVEQDNRAFFTMDYIEGKSLHQSFKGYTKRSLEALLQIIYALATFHSKGFMHGDLKPDNIMYVPEKKKIVLIDFGFAGLVQRNAVCAGTLEYMAPETLKGMGIDQRSDLYSLGVIMYKLFMGKNQVKDYLPIENIPTPINKTIQRLLSQEPAARPTIPELYGVFVQYIGKKSFETVQYTVGLPKLVYVGRNKIIDRIMAKTGTTVIIEGDTGLGKTRLLQEIRYKSLKKGWLVLWCSGREKKQFYEALLEFVDLSTQDIKNRENRFQVYGLLSTALEQKAQDQCMVILVDDLDLLSDYDKDLLRYIGYGIKQKTIVLAGTLTDSKKTTNLGFERVKLDPLSIQEITEMVSSTFHRIAVTKDKKTASTDEFVDWLYAYTDGNPLCGEELLRTIFTKEIMVFQTNAWKVDLSACKKTSIPSKIKDMISMRVSKCNNYELEVLRVLTLVDKPIESTLITETLQHDDEIVIEQLKGSGLILEHLEDSRRLVSMQNRHVAQTVYSGMHKRIRKQYLKKLINVIKKAAKTDDYYMPILSTLYMDIDDRESFYTWSLRAAKHAESIHDYYTAQEFYSKMLEYEDKILSDKGPETRLKLARLHYLLGEPTQAIKYSNEVLKSPRHDLYAGAYAHLGNIYLNMCDYKKAVSSIQKSLEKSATKDDQDDIECAIYSLLCMRTYEDDIIPVIIQPFPPSRNKTDVETLAEALYYQTIYDWLKGNFKSALTRAQETMHLSESKKLNRHYTYTQFVMSIIYHEQNDFNQAHVYIKKALAAFKGMKMDKAVAHVLCMYTRICVAHGNYSKACTLLDDIEVIIQQTDDQHLKYTAMIMRGHIAEDLGHFDEAVGLYNKAQTIAPKAVQPRVEISSVLLKKGVIDEAVSQLPSLRRIKSLELQARYMVLKATIDIHKGRVGNVHATVDKVAKTARQEIRVRAHQNAILLSSTLLYIKLGDFKSALPTLEEVKNAAHVGSKEAFVARVLVKACQVHVGELSEINVDDEIKQLKMMGCLYDVVYCTRIALESILARSRMADTIPSIINELTVSRDISKAIGAGFETQRIEAMLLELYPSFVHGLIDRQMSPEYLNMFTKIGELVNAHLGDDDFASSLLDLVIQATHADRGALFLTSTAGKLTFAAGRNMDQTTIKDARELSQTVLNEVKKDNIVITEDALADSNFSSKKSIIINRIRSLLCVPLSIHSNVIGALYLDSRKTSETFGIRDKDFLRAVANICASVIDRSAVFHALAEQNILLRAKLYEDIDESFVMGKSAQMNKVYQLINNAAKTQSPILLQGETGSGKGMLAQLIHLKSTRKNEKFIVINCGAIPDTLLESELFGHKKGSFTGAIAHKKGLLEEADKGTVLLDEIANTSPSFQAKLLDAIEMKRIRRIGETKMRPVDVRWIFATNRDLDLEVKQKNFREDLFYRINVVKIQVPPLRKRKKDIPILAQHFLKKYSQEMNKQIKGFSAHAQQKMMEYAWPGNVRELQNIIERTVVFVDEDLITDHELDAITTAQRVVSLGSAKKNAAKDTLIKALQASNWNVKKTAQLLGVDRKTVQRYIKKYSIKK